MPDSVIIPHANNYHCPIPSFIALWIALFDAFGDSEADDDREFGISRAIPRRSSKDPLSKQVKAGHQLSLNVLLRLLAPPSYRNTNQATNVFMGLNPGIVVDEAVLSPKGNMINGAKLTDAALLVWNSLTGLQRESLLRDANALIEADIETGEGDKTESDGLDTGPPASAASTSLQVVLPAPPTLPPSSKGASRPDFVRQLVAWIEQDPFQAFHRKKPYGPKVFGWGARLKAYFWPTPAVGIAKNLSVLRPILDEARCVIESRTPRGCKQWLGMTHGFRTP